MCIRDRPKPVQKAKGGLFLFTNPGYNGICCNLRPWAAAQKINEVKNMFLSVILTIAAAYMALQCGLDVYKRQVFFPSGAAAAPLPEAALPAACEPEPEPEHAANRPGSFVM